MASNRLPADARSSRRFVGPTGPGGRVPALDNVFPFPCLGGLLRLIYFRRQGLRWREREKNLIFRRLTSRTKSGRWVSDMFAPALAPSRLALEAPRLRVTRPVPAASLSDGMADQITGRVRLCAHGPSRLPARARSDARAGLVVSSEQFEWQPDSKRPRAGLSEATTDMSSLQVGAATSLVAVALRGVRAQGCWSFSSPPYGGQLRGCPSPLRDSPAKSLCFNARALVAGVYSFGKTWELTCPFWL